MHGKKQESRLIQTFPLIYKLTLQGQYPFFPLLNSLRMQHWGSLQRLLASRTQHPLFTEMPGDILCPQHQLYDILEKANLRRQNTFLCGSTGHTLIHTHTYKHMVYSEFTIWHKIKSRNGIWYFTMKVILCTEGMVLKFSCAKSSPGGDC